jgi:hypothetical protein
MSRRPMIPVAAAMVLSVAAGLSIAQEHTQRYAITAAPPAAEPGSERSPDTDATPRAPASNGGAAGVAGPPSIGVGSRALTGDESDRGEAREGR